MCYNTYMCIFFVAGRFLVAAAVRLLVLVAILGLLGIVVLPLAFVELLVAPLLLDSGLLFALDLAHSVTPALAGLVSVLAVLLTPLLVLLDALFTAASLLVSVLVGRVVRVVRILRGFVRIVR